MSKRKDPNEAPSGNPNNIKLESVNPIWLNVSAQDRWGALNRGPTGWCQSLTAGPCCKSAAHY
jgi:hypothetical protein